MRSPCCINAYKSLPLYSLMKRIVSTILVCLFARFVWGAMPSPAQAQQLFEQQQYDKAEIVYAQLLKRQPDNPLYLYRYARCLQEQGNSAEAIRYFEKAGERYPLRNFYLGELYMADYRFSDAVAAYRKYLAKTDTTNERYSLVLGKIEQAEKGERYLKRVDDIRIIDSIVVDKAEFLKAYHLSRNAGSIGIGNGLGYCINEIQDRKITASEHGLMSCQRLLEGEWICDTLDIPVTSEAHCNFPYMLSDGVTLYFASDDATGLGGYDIYITQYNTNTNSYLIPENIGMPYNSPANDYMLAIDDTKGIGYFATDRHTAGDKVCVYTFIPNEEKRILRDTTDIFIRQFAQGLVLRPAAQKLSATIAPVTSDNKKETVTMKPFVMNDTTVYTRLTDFHSPDARVLYEEYLQTEEQLQTVNSNIGQKRAIYHDAISDEQSVLRKELLQLENDRIRLKKELPALLLKVHQLEGQ